MIRKLETCWGRYTRCSLMNHAGIVLCWAGLGAQQRQRTAVGQHSCASRGASEDRKTTVERQWDNDQLLSALQQLLSALQPSQVTRHLVRAWRGNPRKCSGSRLQWFPPSTHAAVWTYKGTESRCIVDVAKNIDAVASRAPLVYLIVNERA